MSVEFKIFLVEDDPWYGELMKHRLSANPDLEVFLFTSAKDCLEKLHLRPDIVCIDYVLPDQNGETLMSNILKWNSDVPVIIVSAQEKINVAVELLKKGARDYIVKNEHALEMLWQSLHNVTENIRLRRKVNLLQEQLNKELLRDKITGDSEPIKKVLELINKAAGSDINVSLDGESGTGKEVVAKTIHYNSNRKSNPFVAVNMAAIPSELVESELFGFEKGAFTGANSKKPGKFEDADGGTLFLDEICEMNVNLQSKILRVLQEREIVRVGGNKSVKINIRLITATNKNLIDEVKKGSFREDLFYRILGLHITVPPLRIRQGDIVLLSETFINEFNIKNKVSCTLTREAKLKLLKHSYPGNVRELRSVIELACVMSNDNLIRDEDIIFQSINGNALNFNEDKSLNEYRNEIFEYYLNKTGNNIIQVANTLKIGKSTLYNYIKSKTEF
jgi:DNA-binding NtrC family response regulator